MDRESIDGTAFFRGVLDVRGERTAHIIMDDDWNKHEAYFEPSILIGSPGQEITVRVTNRGFIGHTFVIHELGIESWILPADAPGEDGQTKEFEVTFPEGADAYLIRCRILDTGGMTGALVAVE
jgi:plastocyanin